MTKLPKFFEDTAYENSVGRMLRVLTNNLKAEMKSRLRGLDMNINESYVFNILRAKEGLSQTEISEQMSMPNYATSRLIDGMEAKNLLERRVDPCSRRTFRIYLTDEAKEKIPKVIGSLDDINNWILKDLSDREKAAFVSALRKLI